jgi:hypothetical protein
MSDDLPAWAQKRAKPPERRPLWVVVLGLAMLLSGTFGLAGGLSELVKSGPARVPNRSTVAATEAMQAIENTLAGLSAAHPVVTRAAALSRIVMSVLTLLAVAAIFSSHGRARQAALLAGWVGIGQELAAAVSFLVVVVPALGELGPLLSELAAREAWLAGPPPAPTRSARLLATGVAVKTLIGIGFSALILTYFGGRRGRLFFGAGADQGAAAARQPNHGG